jgi:NADP-dependent 3-hydroxy acid dehydrogenase YdfG
MLQWRGNLKVELNRQGLRNVSKRQSGIGTGGARGIGASVAAGYVREGSRVYAADKEFGVVQETAERIGNG